MDLADRKHALQIMMEDSSLHDVWLLPVSAKDSSPSAQKSDGGTENLSINSPPSIKRTKLFHYSSLRNRVTRHNAASGNIDCSVGAQMVFATKLTHKPLLCHTSGSQGVILARLTNQKHA